MIPMTVDFMVEELRKLQKNGKGSHTLCSLDGILDYTTIAVKNTDNSEDIYIISSEVTPK